MAVLMLPLYKRGVCMEKKEKKFEEKMGELESLVKSLENGEVELDQWNGINGIPSSI